MRSTEQWLEEMISSYNENPKEALEDMLSSTTSVIEQYVESPSAASKGLLDSCLKHNKLFLQAVGIVEQEVH
jgi:hypothetical protein